MSQRNAMRGSGGYSAKDSLVATTLAAGPDRAGTYTVTVTHPSYQTWTKTGVVVRRLDDCGTIDGATLQVDLQPLAPG